MSRESAATLLGLGGSVDSRAHGARLLAEGVARTADGQRRDPSHRERGIALILTLTTVAILAVVLADMHENTASSFALATTQRDQLKAEYLARSGINLTRLLVAAEPQIRVAVTPFYQAMIGRPPPQIPIWTYANQVLAPFCDYEQAQGLSETTGVDFGAATGLGETGGTCEIVSFSENSKLNLNDPLHMSGDEARLNVSMQVFAMVGGYQSPSPFDPLFAERDADGQITTRQDIISALVDWWDPDTQRTAFDPGAARVDANAGGEDQIYQSFRDPYQVRNAPFDSLEELRLIRGVGDNFWATFVEPDPEDPTSRSVTIYGSGKVNPNEARPEVLLARTCSILVNQPLCTDPAEAAKFIQLLGMVRAMAPIPWFSRVQDFVEFLQGRGGPQELYPMLQNLGDMVAPLLFTPVTISRTEVSQFHRVLVFGAAILTIQSTGRVGNCNGEGVGRCNRYRIRTVVNFDSRWSPPPPNAGTMPRMGIVHHWRVD